MPLPFAGHAVHLLALSKKRCENHHLLSKAVIAASSSLPQNTAAFLFCTRLDDSILDEQEAEQFFNPPNKPEGIFMDVLKTNALKLSSVNYFVPNALRGSGGPTTLGGSVSLESTKIPWASFA